MMLFKVPNQIVSQFAKNCVKHSFQQTQRQRVTFTHLQRRKYCTAPAQSTPEKIINANTIPPNVRTAEYAVRGEVVIKAEELNKVLQQQKKDGNRALPFDEIVYCNIGNPQALGQKPITFFRQFVALLTYPELLNSPDVNSLFPRDVVERAKKCLERIPSKSINVPSEPQGYQFVREDIAKFIERRDGYPSNPDDIFIFNGASPAVQAILKLAVNDAKSGIMIPIPQYPLYSASISLLGGASIPYYLNEETNWKLSINELEKAIRTSAKTGIEGKCLVIINPGNPTGQVLGEDNMKEIIQFCERHNVLLLADEVYQENVYVKQQKPFTSFKKVLKSMGAEYDKFQLVSFHSISKGFVGECGQRSGYLELHGIDEDVKKNLLKLSSVEVCPNTPGQLLLDVMVNPPKEGEDSYELYSQERDAILNSLKRRAQKVTSFLNTLEGVTCNPAEGAMYAFPQITLPERACAAAAAQSKSPDAFYVLQLLENTGLCVVPGSGFGQQPNTHHFRTTFLPPEDKIDAVLQKMKSFHSQFLEKYQ